MSALSVMENLLIKQAAKMQSVWCKSHSVTRFAPDSGICFVCGRQIYDTPEMQAKAGKQLITGCPHCSWSYCE